MAELPTDKKHVEKLELASLTFLTVLGHLFHRGFFLAHDGLNG